MIEFKKVNKSYNSITGITEILNDADYKFESTGFVALCGRSGCGKTTVFNMIAGLDEDYQGEILYDGENIKSYNKKDKNNFYTNNIFYLKSRDNFIKNLTVKEALDVYLSKDKVDKAYELIKQFELEYLKNKKLKKLSSGELQKISIIIAVTQSAKITLLDEPICNIDESSVRLFLELIKELSKNSLVLYISHYEDDYDDYFTDILTIEDGNIKVNKSSNSTSYLNTNNSKLKYSFKKSMLLEKSKPLGLYMLFRLIIILMASFIIYVTKVNGITVSDIYIDSLDQMSVNIVHTNKTNNNVIDKKKIYSDPSKFSGKYNVYLNSYSYKITGFGRASDFIFSDFKENLSSNEIIVSDYFAYTLDKNIGDEIKVRQSSSIDYKVSYEATYVIKHIYKTNYKAIILKDNYQIPDEYYYVFISDSKMDIIINDSLYSYGGIFLSNAYVAPYNENFVDTHYYDSLTTDGYYDLKDDEFMGGISALSSFGLGSIINDIHLFITGGSDKYYDVTFKSGDLSITKKLKYKKPIDAADHLVVSESLFNELKEYFNITEDNVINYTLVETINPNNAETNDYCKSLDNFSQLTFENDLILTTKMSKIDSLVTFYQSNYFYILSFFIFFIIIAFIKVAQIEAEYYKLLKSKNFSPGTNILLFLCSKIIVYFVLCMVCIVINNFIHVL